MQKTFCDNCGAECRNYVMRIGGEVQQTTSRNEMVSEGYMQRRELCKDCAGPVIALARLEVLSEAQMIQEKMERNGDFAGIEVPG